MVLGRFRRDIYSFAYYFLRNTDEAEDVAQEVLLKLWRHLPELNEQHVQPWIIRVTRNSCIDALRKRKTRQNLFREESGADGLSAIQSALPNPAELLERQDFRLHCEAAIAQLAEPYRSILILREIQDMKYEDIAQALELPLNRVKVYLFRARKMLRDIIRKVVRHESVPE